MRFSVEGLSDRLAAGVKEGLAAAGHEPGEPADLAVVGVDLPVGTDVVDVSGRLGGHDRVLPGRVLRDPARSRVHGRARGRRTSSCSPAHGRWPSRGCGAAAIAGSFLTTVGQVAAVELAPKGIRVNVVAVGPLEGEAPERVAEAVPTGRLVRAREVGDVCALLAAPEADAVNGAVIAVDGGYAVTKAAGAARSPARTDVSR